MIKRFQFSLMQLGLATAFFAVAACLLRLFYDAVPIQPWQAALPIASTALLGAGIGALVSSRPRSIKMGFLIGAIASSAIILPLLAHALLMDYFFGPILQNG
jgi:hypothetical protein